MNEPGIGHPEIGVLSRVLVYRSNMVKQLTLIATIKQLPWRYQSLGHTGTLLKSQLT